ncbi:unnamed protein product [Lampetra fluviatilis]
MGGTKGARAKQAAADKKLVEQRGHSALQLEIEPGVRITCKRAAQQLTADHEPADSGTPSTSSVERA